MAASPAPLNLLGGAAQHRRAGAGHNRRNQQAVTRVAKCPPRCGVRLRPESFG